MARVLAEAAWARKTYPNILKRRRAGATVEALLVRTCITKGAFAELRAACVRQGGPLTGEFLDLEREIDGLAVANRGFLLVEPVNVTIQKGFHAGLGEQLALIEAKATDLRQKAFDTLPAESMIRIAISVEGVRGRARRTLKTLAPSISTGTPDHPGGTMIQRRTNPVKRDAFKAWLPSYNPQWSELDPASGVLGDGEP